MYGATHNHATQGFVVKKSRSRRWGRRLRARTARKHLFFEMLERRDLLANGVLQGVAFVDSNGNDTLDPGEPLKQGAQIVLYKSPDWDNAVATATTDANGEYLFDFGVLGLPGGTYRLKEIPPSGYAADGTQIISPTNPASQIAPDTIQVTVIDPAWVYYASRATSLPEILITDQVYGASPTTTTATQFNIRVDQTPTMASPYFLTLCMDRQSAVSAGNIFQVYQEPLPPNSFVVNNVNAGRIAYLYHTYGTTLRTQMEIAGLQVAVWELVYDASPNLASGNYQLTSAKWTGFDVTESVRAQANTYLTDAASKSGRAILLDSTLDGTEPLKTGRQSMLAPQSLNFANRSECPACPPHPLTLVLDDPNTSGIDRIVVDNMPAGTAAPWISPAAVSTDADLAATAGEVFFTGSIGLNFSSVKTTLKDVGTARAPDLSLSSSVLTRNGGGTLVIEGSLGYRLDPGTQYTLTSPIGGTTHGTVNFSESLSPNGATNQLGPFSGPAFSGQATTSFSTPSGACGVCMVLEKEVTVAHPRGTKLTTLGAGGTISAATAEVCEVPDSRGLPSPADLVFADLGAGAWNSTRGFGLVASAADRGTLAEEARTAARPVDSQLPTLPGTKQVAKAKAATRAVPAAEVSAPFDLRALDSLLSDLGAEWKR